MSYLLKNTSQVVATLERTAQIIKDEVNQHFKEMNYDVSYEQWTVIKAINNNTGLTQIELSKSCHKHPASVSRTLDHLLKKGLIKKEKDEENKKVKRIFLTTKGQRLTENARKAVEKVSKRCLENIFDRELNLFIQILDRIQENHG